MNQETVQIAVPKTALVEAFLEKIARTSTPPDVPLTDGQARAALLPALGAPLDGGVYAGLTIHLGMPHALVLLPGDEEKLWKEACAWAEAQGGSLPTRMDALALWQNLPGEFKKEWYWTQEEYAGNADYAWIQSFSNGYQSFLLKTDDYRCRAVRRVAI